MGSSNPDLIEDGTPPEPHSSSITNASKSKCTPLLFITDFVFEITKALIQMPQFKKALANDSPGRWRRAASVFCMIILALLLLITIVFPIFIATIVLTGRVDWINDHVERHKFHRGTQAAPSKSSIPGREQVRSLTKPASHRLLRTGVVTATRLGIVALVWLAINLSVPTLREHAQLLGSPLWKWSVLAVVVLLLTPTMLLLAYILTTSLRYGEKHTNNIYWIRGVEDSVRWVLYFASVLLVWLVYFLADYDDIKKAYHVAFPIHKYIILTLVAFLIGAVLGLLKIIVVVWWKSRFIYTPLNRGKIMVSAYQVSLLLLLFLSDDKEDESKRKVLSKLDEVRVIQRSTSRTSSTYTEKDTRSTIMDYKGKVLGLQDVDEAAKWLTKLIDVPKDETRASGDLDSDLHICIQDIPRETEDKMEGDPMSEFPPRVEKFLQDMFELGLGMGIDTRKFNEVSYAKFRNWMVNSSDSEIGRYKYSSSDVFINKLYEGFAMTDILYRILTVVQLVVTFLVWLFITHLATAKLVLTLGSLFVGLAFVFGDTCKTFFQGCIFSFVTHPLDVGDKVRIDSNSATLEVKRINVMTTIFFPTANKENIVIYPNSDLATKMIIKLKDAPEPENLTGAKREIPIQKPLHRCCCCQCVCETKRTDASTSTSSQGS